MKVQLEINIPTELLDIMSCHLNCTQDQFVNNTEAVQCLVQHLVDETKDYDRGEVLGSWADADYMFPTLAAIIDKETSK